MKISNTLNELLKKVVESNCSDLHISCGQVPFMRLDGLLLPLTEFKKITNDQLVEILDSIMSDDQKNFYIKNKEIDFAISFGSSGRFRVNAFNTIKGSALALRHISSKITTLDEIKTPSVLSELCKLNQGLVLVVGPTGSGKSTTLSAMINHINQSYQKHIITIEDPVEFVYENQLSLINQREIGSSSDSFSIALKSALREDPNVILVGEMRDSETIQLALTAAETGHLIFGTLHTNSAAQSVNRIIDSFSANDKNLIRSMLSTSLKAVVSQRLVKKNGGGRVAVFEVMVVNHSISNLIREDKIPQIKSMIEMGQRYGMVSIQQSVSDLFSQKIIDKQTALSLITSAE